MVCLRWVDDKFEAHEDFVGLHHVDDIKTDTVVGVLKDTILRMGIKQVKPMSDALDHSLEICKLIKFSPRRDAIFQKVKQELSPNLPGLRTMCPTR